AVSGCCLALQLPLAIAGQRSQAQPVLAAEVNPAQPTAFVLARHLLGFGASPPTPNFHHLCLFVHPSTASPTPSREQMGWSNAYGRLVVFEDTTDKRCMICFIHAP